jgi:hypothetical protein
MQSHAARLATIATLASFSFLAMPDRLRADPPSRIARLGYVTGEVSFSPAGESDWEEASVNRPLTSGDRVWSAANARAEIEIGGALVRLSADAGMSVLNLDDEIAQLQLTEGRLNVRVRHLDRGQVFEIDTPNLAFTVREPAEFRIQVDPDRDATTIIVREGEGEVYGDGAAYVIDSRQPYRFTGTDLSDYDLVDAPRFDDFDGWSRDRDRRYESSVSARYVSPDVVGYQDLDAYGSWRTDATYGHVWSPNRVSANWSPYRDGRWAWIDPWGWTWVDDAPWGFAVSHYGRWARLHDRWCWVPGPARSRAYYAPALVVFVGGANFQLSISSRNVGGVAWFPLGPREVYRPSYRASRSYFENLNRSNTFLADADLRDSYDRRSRGNEGYVNRRVRGAVIAVPRTAFADAQPVSRVVQPAPRRAVDSGPVDFAPPVAPTQRSVRTAVRRERPPARGFERPVVASRPAPEAHVGFSVQERQLAAQPGKPLDEETRKRLKRAPNAPAPVVRVVRQSGAPLPTARPPRRGGPGPRDARPSEESRDARRGAPSRPQARDERGQPNVAAPPPRDDDRRSKLVPPPRDDDRRADDRRTEPEDAAGQ